jgi:hypothetical protein
MGKPVVSTKNFGLARFAPFVTFASTNDEFCDSIGKTLEGDVSEKRDARAAWARENSYERRVSEMLEKLL